MRIFDYEKIKFSEISQQINGQKGNLLPYLARYPAPLFIHAIHVFVKLFARHRPLGGRVHYDDDALCAGALFYFADLLVIPTGQTRPIALYRPSLGL